MPSSDTVVLIGPMAVGKTAVGRMLARRTGRTFVDTDRVLVERYGPIRGLFDQHGEDGFRLLEADVVQGAVSEAGIVSLGGGAVLDAGTQHILRDAAVVFLDTDAKTVLPRISRDAKRPLLAGNPLERWQELYDQRRPLYARLASVVIDTRGLSVRGTADAVVRALPHLLPDRHTASPPHSAGQNHESRTDTHGD